MPYPNDLLSTRAVIKPNLYAVIPPEGLVINTLPYLNKCKASILCSPKIGASFVEYKVQMEPGGGTIYPFAKEEGIESFLYVLSGNVSVIVDNEKKNLSEGGYVFAPPSMGMEFVNEDAVPASILLYKQKNIHLEGRESWVVWGNVNNIEYKHYDQMENVLIKDLLPSDFAFDMNMHILSFLPGGCHPIVETHVQEHGAFVLNGKGMYMLDDKWMGIKREDFIWFGPYVPQCAYGVGREPFTYIYSKDCNRDVQL